MKFSVSSAVCFTSRVAMLLLLPPVDAYIDPGASGELNAELNQERRVWVKYKAGHREACLHSMANFESRSMPAVRVHHEFPRVGTFVVSATVEEINELSQDPMVDEIVEDVKRYPMHIPESMQARELQGEEVPYGVSMVQATDAHAIGFTGLGAKVCVVDTGIDRDHEDFVTSRLSGLESNSLDWKSDAVGHGTHCSGTIAAAKNGIGVVGVAPDAELYTVKVFNDNGGFAYGSSIVSAVEECVEAGFNIVSMSLGGPLPNIFEWFAYQNLLENGVISIAAAGNSGNRMQSYPASYPGVVSVAAVDEDFNVASFSQRNRNVDIAAPGVDVLSTFSTDGCSICDSLGVKKYGVISGTSMATPHVAGVAALLRGAFPDADGQTIVDALLDSALPLGSSEKDVSYGNGLVQAIEALKLLNGGSLPSNPDGDPPTSPQPPSNGRCPANSLKVDVSLITDNSGADSYWQITRDRDSYPMALGSRLDSNTQYDYTDCLPSDCYSFSLFDVGSNGICCEEGQGSYSLSVNGAVIGNNQQFDTSVSHTFGTCSTGVLESSELSCVPVSAVVKTDVYPDENMLELVDNGDGSIIWSIFFEEKEALYEDMNACLDPMGCYTFTMEDSYGDGICCSFGEGYVTLTYDGESLVTTDDAAFGTAFSVTFGKCD